MFHTNKEFLEQLSNYQLYTFVNKQSEGISQIEYCVSLLAFKDMWTRVAAKRT